MPSTPKIRTLHRAAQIVGNEKALAERLGVSGEDVANWLSGAVVPDDGVYLVLLDIVAGGQSRLTTKLPKPR
jgi:DNA-binding transcriptional regulator YiaG